MPRKIEAKLVLEDGSIFEGVSFGAETGTGGEVVFNTGMVGYNESLTDPSYRGQILTLTYPMVGNYGVPEKTKNEFGFSKFFESEKIRVQGLVVADYSEKYSHWNAKQSLGEWLKGENIPAITGIDTRALTKKLREHGVMLGRIVIGDSEAEPEDPNKRNLVSEVSCKEAAEYGKGKKTVAVLDCGAKNNIFRSFLERGVKILRVPWDYPLLDRNESFDGILISNGPGDPTMADKTVETVREAMEADIPIFGICMGNQILSLAAGAKTYKLKFGHRSQNQPCLDLLTKRCYITSQNHGYAVDTAALNNEWEPWFGNANDGTNEGIRHKTKPFRSVQFHPEAWPGPVDTAFLFDKFIKELPK